MLWEKQKTWRKLKSNLKTLYENKRNLLIEKGNKRKNTPLLISHEKRNNNKKENLSNSIKN